MRRRRASGCSVGAQPSDTVARLFRSLGILPEETAKPAAKAAKG